MGRDYCCMPKCSNHPGKIGKFGVPVKLHRLPVKKSLRSAWILAISRKNFKPSSYTRVCSDHFTYGVGPNKHNPDKVPSLFLAQKSGNVKKRVRKEPADRPSQTQVTLDDGNVDPGSSVPSTSVGDIKETISRVHSYSLIETFSEPGDAIQQETSDSSTSDQHSQTSIDVNDACTQALRPEITIEDIKGSDQEIQFYTGLPDYITFNALFQTFIQHGAENLTISTEVNNVNKTPTRKLRLIDEFLLVLMRLRLGLLVKDLAYRFKISAASVSRIFNSWIIFMNQCLKGLVFLPPLEVLQKNIPKCFENFRDTRVILDCTELFIQTPSSLENKSATYSNYKSHNTFKCLVGVNMTGAVVFLSELYGGSASDTDITRKSGLYDMLNKGDAVMVDKGFIHIKPDLAKMDVKLYCPPFRTKSQFSKQEVEITRRIASARIHVERKMEQIKNFRLLQGIIPLSLSHIANEIFHVCAALTNLLPPLAQ